MGEKPDNLKKTSKTISPAQKASLEAAGYKVKGSAVLTKEGKTVGGWNENNQISSGSAKVSAILKSTSTLQKPVPKASARAVPKTQNRKEAPVNKTDTLVKRIGAAIDRSDRKPQMDSAGPTPIKSPEPGKLVRANSSGLRAVSGGSRVGSPVAARKAPERPTSPTRSASATGRSSVYEKARLGNITEASWDSMSRVQREAKGLPVTWADYVKSGGDSVVKKTTGPTVAKAPNRADAYKLQNKKKK